MPLIIPSSATGPQPTVPKKKVNLWFWVLGGVLAAVIGVVIWVGVTGAVALKNIIAKGNHTTSSALLNGNLTPSQVKTEGDTRINILLAGIAGIPNHGGTDLTDTLEVMSLDPVNKTMTLVSVPRDLWVTLPDGSKGKINAINTEGAQYCKKNTCVAGSDPGGDAMEAMIGNLLGIKINYFVRMDFNAFKDTVDTLGGIQVNVPSALYDPLYPNDVTNGYMTISFKPGLQTMTGTQALEYARSRETTSDFDRSKRQQLIISAIRDKALSLGILANPLKVTGLLNDLGSNVKTDIQPSAMTPLINLIRSLDSGKTTTAVLDTTAGGPLESSTGPGGTYIIVPVAGLNDFAGVQAFVAHALPDPNILKENATIAIVNASGRPALGTNVETELKSLGYNVVGITTADALQTNTTLTNDTRTPFTSTLLQKRTSGSFMTGSSVPGADITLTLGTTYKDNGN